MSPDAHEPPPSTLSTTGDGGYRVVDAVNTREYGAFAAARRQSGLINYPTSPERMSAAVDTLEILHLAKIIAVDLFGDEHWHAHVFETYDRLLQQLVRDARTQPQPPG